MQNNKSRVLQYAIIVTLFMAGTMGLQAQKVEIGFRYMPTLSKFDVVTADNGKVTGDFKYGYGLGGFVGFNFNEHVGIQVEVIYNTISQKYSEYDAEKEIELKYFNIPLLFSLNTNKNKPVNFNLVVGPEIGINVGSSLSGGDGTGNTNALLSVKKGNVGLAYGAGIDFGLNEAKTVRLGIGYRGVEGLVDISNDSDTVVTDTYYILDKSRTSTYALYAGLSVMF